MEVQDEPFTALLFFPFFLCVANFIVLFYFQVKESNFMCQEMSRDL